MTEFEKVMMKRDGMTREEAREEREMISDEITSAIESGVSYSEIEDILLYDCGLEMDYIFDLI